MSLQDPEKGSQPPDEHENGFGQRSEKEAMDSKPASILPSGASLPAATFTQASTAEDPNLATFDGPDDPYNPYNLPMWKKWFYAIIVGSLSLVVTFATSTFAPGTVQCATELGVSLEVMYLVTALFIAGQLSTPHCLARTLPRIWQRPNSCAKHLLPQVSPLDPCSMVPCLNSMAVKPRFSWDTAFL
jgi:hypothetical protein